MKDKESEAIFQKGCVIDHLHNDINDEEIHLNCDCFKLKYILQNELSQLNSKVSVLLNIINTYSSYDSSSYKEAIQDI